jgi:hypothetical protein
MQFGYDARPSFWQGLQSNAHLVIAAVGTAALLGVAAVALWLALPANERQASASVPTIPVKTTKIASVVANATVTAAAVPQAARKADAVSAAATVRQAAIQALAPNNPRWSATGAGDAPAPASNAANKTANGPAGQKAIDTAFAEPAAETDASTALSQVAASAPTAAQAADGKKPDDGAQTAAIPQTQPQAPAAQPADDNADQAKPKPEKVSAAANGRILRAVTMRAGPKKGASAITTVPAKASVQVKSCNKWCEIVYNGKHGWIYKSYVKTGI